MRRYSLGGMSRQKYTNTNALVNLSGRLIDRYYRVHLVHTRHWVASIPWLTVSPWDTNLPAKTLKRWI